MYTIDGDRTRHISETYNITILSSKLKFQNEEGIVEMNFLSERGTMLLMQISYVG